MSAQQPAPQNSELMKAWKEYQETEDFKNSLFLATTTTVVRQERVEELGLVDPEANQADPRQREQYAKGSLWAAFSKGFEAAGGKVRFGPSDYDK